MPAEFASSKSRKAQSPHSRRNPTTPKSRVLFRSLIYNQQAAAKFPPCYSLFRNPAAAGDAGGAAAPRRRARKEATMRAKWKKKRMRRLKRKRRKMRQRSK